MADTSIPTPTLAEQSAKEAVAPNAFGGWSFFQSQVNVTLPVRLHELESLLAHADRIMGG